jgi:hypothetical protein
LLIYQIWMKYWQMLCSINHFLAILLYHH